MAYKHGVDMNFLVHHLGGSMCGSLLETEGLDLNADGSDDEDVLFLDDNMSYKPRISSITEEMLRAKAFLQA